MLFWRECEPNFEILDVVKGRISDRFRILFDNKVALLRLLFRLPLGGDGLRWLPSESSAELSAKVDRRTIKIIESTFEL